MNKSLLIVVGVIGVATVGYIVYMSYFTVKSTVVGDAGIIDEVENTQPFVMPTTEEQKLDALNELMSPANSPSTADDSAKEEFLNGSIQATGSDNNSAGNSSGNPADESEKVKLLESLKK